MKAKVLHYAADRDDKIVATYKEVTFIGKHVGWYVEDKDEKHEGRDTIAIVERVDGICFVAEFLSRNAAFDKEHLAAVEAEARNLRAAMQKRIAQKQWIPLTYVAAYEALGWDARPLKEHRDQMRRFREAADRKRKLAQAEQAGRARQEQVQRAEEAFRRGGFIPAEHFVGLCRKHGVEIHPRTLGTLRTRIKELSRTQILCRGGGRGTRIPSVDGCSRLIDHLTEKLK